MSMLAVILRGWLPVRVSHSLLTGYTPSYDCNELVLQYNPLCYFVSSIGKVSIIHVHTYIGKYYCYSHCMICCNDLFLWFGVVICCDFWYFKHFIISTNACYQWPIHEVDFIVYNHKVCKSCSWNTSVFWTTPDDICSWGLHHPHISWMVGTVSWWFVTNTHTSVFLFCPWICTATVFIVRHTVLQLWYDWLFRLSIISCTLIREMTGCSEMSVFFCVP